MKVIIEHKNLTATTDDLDLVVEICRILQKEPYAETTPVITKELYQTPSDIPSSAYLTIRSEGITCGGKPTDTYNDEEIWNAEDAVRYFTESIPLFKQESGLNVTELHVLQSSTPGKYAEPGDPVADPDGKYCWCRIKTKDGRLSRWVFRGAYSSVADCRSGCADYCGYNVRGDSGMRAGVFGSVGD